MIVIDPNLKVDDVRIREDYFPEVIYYTFVY